MNIEAAILGHCRKPPADLIRMIDDGLKSSRIEARECQFAARFLHLLRDATAKIVQLPVELVDLLLVVHTLQCRGGDRAVECASALQNIRYLVAQALARVHRPDEHSHGEGNYRSEQGVEHAQPCHVPGLRDSTEYHNECCSKSRCAEHRVKSREIGEERSQDEESDSGAHGSSAKQWQQESRRQSTAGRADGAVKRGFPGCANIGLCHHQRGEHRPIALRQIPTRIDCVSDRSGKSSLDSLFQGSGFTAPKRRSRW